ncbi:MAG TPA: ArgE/DapE family deacylase [Armatimonadota bacterium]|nr:ArgE/DapE family deacylase [Armatimonadota bacterium]
MNEIECRLCRAVEAGADEARGFLLDLIRIPSTTGNERPAADLVLERCRGLEVKVAAVPVPADLKHDPDYTFADQELSYQDRPNVVALRRGTGGGHSLIVQSHLDVVPAPPSWGEAFAPVVDGDTIIGRGACDAKGQVAAIILALQALDDAGVGLRGDVQSQFVIDEEVGGNGALALIKQGYRADAALIMEGTNLDIHPANRGALWFRLRVTGKSVHMGRAHEGVNAIEKTAALFPALRKYEQRIVAESAGQPQFERYQRPVQVNLGIMRAGDWPSTVAGESVLEGGVGFLTNKRMEDIKRELREVIESAADQWTRAHYELDFPKLHNDAYADDPDHPAVAALAAACRELGLGSEVYGWNVSCDARLYHHRGGMPTIVFGAGSVADAHAVGEKVDFRQVVQAAQAVALMCVRWCGSP